MTATARQSSSRQPPLLTLVDANTGEIVPLTEKRRYAYPAGGHFTCSLDLGRLTQYNLSKIELTLLLLMFPRYSDGQYHPLNVSTVAEELGFTRARLNNALGRLVELKIVLKSRVNTRPGQYMVNPIIAFYGGSIPHAEAVSRYGTPLAPPPATGVTPRDQQETA